MLTFVVDADETIAALRQAENGIQRLVDEVATELSEQLQAEAGKDSARLGAAWPVEGFGPSWRKVEAPEWWAHFIAGGTKAHGPRRAKRLMFEIDGQTIAARRVAGIAATHFDDRAVKRAESRLDEILRRVLSEVL